MDGEDNNDDTEDESIDTRTESEILHDNEVCRELLEELEWSSDEDDESAHEATHNAEGSNDEVRLKKERRNTIHFLKVAHKIKCDEDGNIIENRHVNLLLTEKGGDQHYSTITNFNRLARSQVTSNHRQLYFYYSCLHGFSTPELLKDHKTLSHGTEAQPEVFHYKYHLKSS